MSLIWLRSITGKRRTRFLLNQASRTTSTTFSYLSSPNTLNTQMIMRLRIYVSILTISRLFLILLNQPKMRLQFLFSVWSQLLIAGQRTSLNMHLICSRIETTWLSLSLTLLLRMLYLISSQSLAKSLRTLLVMFCISYTEINSMNKTCQSQEHVKTI